MAQGRKAKHTGWQIREAARTEAGYEQRDVPKKQAQARVRATGHKTEDGGRKPGGSGRGRVTKPAGPLRKGSAVEWKNGAGKAVGEVLQVFRDRVVKTIKGSRIRRNATPEEPAFLVQSNNGGTALHSGSELKRSRGSPARTKKK